MGEICSTAPFRVRLFDAPEDNTDRLIDLLPFDHPIERLSGTPSDLWWHVRFQRRGHLVEGYMCRSDLEPAERGATVGPLAAPGTARRALPVAHLGENHPIARRDTRSSGWAFPIGEPERPSRSGITPEAKKPDYLAIVDWLNVEHGARYRPEANAYFNIFAHDVCYLCGVYTPRVWWIATAIKQVLQGENLTSRYEHTIHELSANALYNWMEQFGSDFGWCICTNLDDRTPRRTYRRAS